MLAKDSPRRSVAQAKSAYNIMELVGRFAAGDQWTDACALVCYRASEEVRSKLFSEQYIILDELHQRITHTGNILGQAHRLPLATDLRGPFVWNWGRARWGSYKVNGVSTSLSRYIIDFDTMHQRNIDNGRTRKVRRVHVVR